MGRDNRKVKWYKLALNIVNKIAHWKPKEHDPKQNMRERKWWNSDPEIKQEDKRASSRSRKKKDRPF